MIITLQSYADRFLLDEESTNVRRARAGFHIYGVDTVRRGQLFPCTVDSEFGAQVGLCDQGAIDRGEATQIPMSNWMRFCRKDAQYGVFAGWFIGVKSGGDEAIVNRDQLGWDELMNMSVPREDAMKMLRRMEKGALGEVYD